MGLVRFGSEEDSTVLGLPLVSERGSTANRSFFWFALVGVLALVPLDIFF